MTCGLASGIEVMNIDSEIIELKRIAIADTIIASISGKIYLKHINKKDTLIDKLAYANIWVKDLKTDSLIGTTTNSKGEFQFNIPSSTWHYPISIACADGLLELGPTNSISCLSLIHI